MQCQFCGEDLESGSTRCPSCRRVQYRYALDDLDEVIARRDAADAEQSRIDSLYGQKDELLGELGDMLREASPKPVPPRPSAPPPPTPPPMSKPQQPEAPEWVREYQKRPKTARPKRPSQPSPETVKKQAGCLGQFIALGFLLFFIVPWALTLVRDPGSFRISSAIIPFLIGLAIVRSIRRQRQR